LSQLPSTLNADLPSLDHENIPEVKQVSFVVETSSPIIEWFSRFSSFDKLLAVVSWVRRFIGLCLRIKYTFPYPTCLEINESLICVVRYSQRLHLSQLSQELASPRPISKAWVHLRPFIDDKDVVRVGGRLLHANISDDQKHPILLSRHSHLSVLIVRHWHKVLCHAGPLAMYINYTAILNCCCSSPSQACHYEVYHLCPFLRKESDSYHG